MSCRFDKNIIQRYIDNEADPLEMIFLKEHLKYCSDCQKDVELLTIADRNIYKLCNDIKLPLDLDAFTEKFVESCIEERKNRRGFIKLLHGSLNLTRKVANNTSKIVDYIPGTRLVKKGVAVSAEYIAAGTKSYLKGIMKKAISNIM
ncbi:MAG: anti-sigma factor family protein [Bacillota bacterium]